jgi:HD-like signal output (HDOD) protein
MSSSNDSPNLATIERLVAALKPLPPTARVLARLQRLLVDVNSGLDDIAGLIRLDPALATRVIKISNSTWFRRGLPCGTIEEAVNRVGFREVYRVVAVVASRSLVAQPLPAYGRDAHTMWRESVACACAAEQIAERLGEEMPVAYVSGLLHAIGRLPINQYLRPAGEIGGPHLVEESFPREHSGAESALLGFNQAAVGAFMLTGWEFTSATILAVQHQYEPLEAEEPHDRMAAVLYAARLLRTIICQNVPAAELSLDDDILGLLRLSPDDVLSHLPAVRDQLARAEQMTMV